MELLIVVGLLGAVAGALFWVSGSKKDHLPPVDEEPLKPILSAAPMPRSAPVPGEVSRQIGPRVAEPSGSYRIEYADAYGEVTERTISDLKRRSLDGTVYIEAFCHLRGDRRTFRADRILALRDMQRALVSNNPVFFLGAGLEDVRTRPAETHVRAMQHVEPGLVVLIWIARTDRDVDAAEAALLIEFAQARHAMVKARTEQGLDMNWLKVWIDEAGPTKAICLRALSDIPKASPGYALLADYAVRLVRTTGASAAKKEGRRRQLFG